MQTFVFKSSDIALPTQAQDVTLPKGLCTTPIIDLFLIAIQTMVVMYLYKLSDFSTKIILIPLFSSFNSDSS